MLSVFGVIETWLFVKQKQKKKNEAFLNRGRPEKDHRLIGWGNQQTIFFGPSGLKSPLSIFLGPPSKAKRKKGNLRISLPPQKPLKALNEKKRLLRHTSFSIQKKSCQNNNNKFMTKSVFNKKIFF